MNARKGIKTKRRETCPREDRRQKKMNARKGIKTLAHISLYLGFSKSEEDECPQGH